MHTRKFPGQTRTQRVYLLTQGGLCSLESSEVSSEFYASESTEGAIKHAGQLQESCVVSKIC